MPKSEWMTVVAITCLKAAVPTKINRIVWLA
jgi:hypothetical protein